MNYVRSEVLKTVEVMQSILADGALIEAVEVWPSLALGRYCKVARSCFAAMGEAPATASTWLRNW